MSRLAAHSDVSATPRRSGFLMHDALPSADTLTDLEYAVPCGRKVCPKQAEFVVFITHEYKACPGSIYYCQACKDWAMKLWGAWLRRLEGKPCGRCGQIVTGLLSENFRVLPL